jgi:hypothetical protein
LGTTNARLPRNTLMAIGSRAAAGNQKKREEHGVDRTHDDPPYPSYSVADLCIAG